MSSTRLHPSLLISAYCQGMFPMALDGEIYWFDPDPRAILPLDGFHISRSLRRSLKRVWVDEGTGRSRPLVAETGQTPDRPPFEIRLNTAFDAVLAGCADPRREGGWINGEIQSIYRQLHDLGWAHSVETWQDGRLVGGLYGVAIRGFFAGESMFSGISDASKFALVYLVNRLRARDFLLLDVQFQTPHLARFGAIEISRGRYRRLLAEAISVETQFED